MGTRWTRSWAASLLVASMASATALPSLASGMTPGPGAVLAVIVDGTSTDTSAAAVHAVGGIVVAPLDLIGAVAATIPSHAVAGLSAAGFLVVGEVQLDAAIERRAALHEREQRPGVGREIRFELLFHFAKRFCHDLSRPST